MDTPVIQFSGLLLRPFEDADASAFTAAVLESVASVNPWMAWCAAGYTTGDALEWFATCRAERAAGTALEFGIFDAQTNELLGGAGLNEIRHQHHLCNLGYWVRQSRQCQGIATRCVRGLSSYGFSRLGLQRIEIVVAVGNVGSEQVALKAGALREGIARNRLDINGRQVPAHMFSLVP